LGATTKGQENSEIGNSKEDFHLVGGIRYYEALPEYVRVPSQFYPESQKIHQKEISMPKQAIKELNRPERLR
jgi:hypothetical protein